MKGGLRAWGEASHFPEDSEHRRVPKIHPTVTEQPPRKRPAFCALRMNAHTLLSTKAWSAAGGQAFPHEPSLKQVLGVFPAQGLRVQRTEHAGPQESPWQVLPGDVFSQEGGSCLFSRLQSTWKGVGLFVYVSHDSYRWS